LGLSLLFVTAMVPSQAAADGVSLQERAEILDIISRYSYTWDGRDGAAWVKLFTDDAVLSATFQKTLAWTHASNKGRLAFIEEFYRSTAGQGLLQTRHYQTNTVLEKQADGSIAARSMFQVSVQFQGEAGPRVANSGVYVDRFVKTADGWKFARRDIMVDQPMPPPPAQ
jgi:3-phenylpropionate/cinnamic acid dioxygenase small subunit